MRERLSQYVPKFGGLYDFLDKANNSTDRVLYTLARTQRIFRYEGLPETIPQRDLELGIQTCGQMAIGQTEKGLYAVVGGLGSEPNAYYMPTEVHYANPVLGSGNWIIDTDCVVMRNDSMYMGLLPLITRYTTALAENDLTMRLVDILARVNTAIAAGDDTTMESAREFIRQIIAGKISPIASNDFLEGVRSIPMTASGNKVTLTDLIEYEQYLQASLYNELGIEANFNMKREALNSNETDTNRKILLPLIDDMMKCRQEDIKKVNEMFGLNISVRFDGIWEDLEREREEVRADESEGSESNVDDGRDNHEIDEPTGNGGMADDDQR